VVLASPTLPIGLHAGRKVSKPGIKGNEAKFSRFFKGLISIGCEVDPFMVSQPVWPSENSILTVAQRPAKGGLLRISHRSPGSDLGVLRPKSPIVSRGHLKNSRFRETATGDRVRSALLAELALYLAKFSALGD
jgi:hypothetical protein